MVGRRHPRSVGIPVQQVESRGRLALQVVADDVGPDQVVGAQHGGALNYEAAVGAAIPVIKTLREGLAGTGVNRVYGILNGTCNYILTRMEQEGLSFAECLKDAQRLGYAEANPSFDVDGHDTAQKLAILASLAFGTKVAQSAVYVEGISSIAPEDLRAAEDLGYRVKLLGVAVRTAEGIEQRVHPTMSRSPRTSVAGTETCAAATSAF